MEITKKKLSEIVYRVVKVWTESERFERYDLKTYDNWKDDLIDTIWRELRGIIK